MRLAPLFALAALLPGLLIAPRARAAPSVQAISDAITELDVVRAKELLSRAQAETPGLSFERARLAIYLGDCDSAAAILSAPSFSGSPEGQALGDLARRCAGATAGSVVVDDEVNGIWIRLQDERDRVLVPFLTRAAVRARDQIGRDLGVELPRPLRLDLVRDLFSLSAVSGLPVEAAETTGTVAVARWGRVTMITPRATVLGYPWEDTLAHEITHLLLSRATRDFAPLWLQEGIAKREETRWRDERPFDDSYDPTAHARSALLSGSSVGIDQLGPSIAMLPTPEAASTAFAEVTSFMNYWIEQNGLPALSLLLIDLKGIGTRDASAAMESVTGFGLSTWNLRWQKHLREMEAPKARAETPAVPKDLARLVRLGDLAYSRGHLRAAALEHDRAMKAFPVDGALRFRASRSWRGVGDAEQARSTLGEVAALQTAHGGWLALRGREQAAKGEKGAATSFDTALGLDPLSEWVACKGLGRFPAAPGQKSPPAPVFSGDPAWEALCASARKPTEN
ncbi:MAG: hypothetical protein R3B13_13275 [Polyangiaceae bacterium]